MAGVCVEQYFAPKSVAWLYIGCLVHKSKFLGTLLSSYELKSRGSVLSVLLLLSNLHRYCAMLHPPCGDNEGELSACYQVPLQITVDYLPVIYALR